MTKPSRNPRWTREQIRQARMAQLLPLLQRARMETIEAEAGNYTLADYPGVIVKESYWRWPDRELSGNAIDFLVKIRVLSFQKAMKYILSVD